MRQSNQLLCMRSPRNIELPETKSTKFSLFLKRTIFDQDVTQDADDIYRYYSDDNNK